MIVINDNKDLNNEQIKTGSYIMTTSEKQRLLPLLKVQILCELSNSLSQSSKTGSKKHFWRVDSSFLNVIFSNIWLYLCMYSMFYLLHDIACSLCKLTNYVCQLLTSVLVKNFGVLLHCLNAHSNITNM